MAEHKETKAEATARRADEQEEARAEAAHDKAAHDKAHATAPHLADPKKAKAEPRFKAGDFASVLSEGHPFNGQACNVESVKEVDGKYVCSCVTPGGRNAFNAFDDQLTAKRRPSIN